MMAAARTTTIGFGRHWEFNERIVVPFAATVLLVSAVLWVHKPDRAMQGAFRIHASS
jgi:hypothetical protein